MRGDADGSSCARGGRNVGYAMVLVTARYVMAFVLAGTLALLATLPVPRRVHPLALLVGVAIPIGLESIDDRSAGASRSSCRSSARWWPARDPDATHGSCGLSA